MKTESININTLQALYYHNKNNLMPIMIIIGCLVLFLSFILPQIQELFSIRDQENALRAQINSLQTKYNVIQNLDDTSLEDNFRIASKALPSYKDYAGIITGISKAAAKSGVSLSDFSFSVGDLSTKSAMLTAPPSISISLSLRGNLELTKTFIKNLSHQSPLSEIISVEANKSSSTLITNFYYKPFPPLKFSADIPIEPLSNPNNELIQTLSSWGN